MTTLPKTRALGHIQRILNFPKIAMRTAFALITAMLLASFVSSMIAQANATSNAGVQIDMTIPALDSKPNWDPRLD